MAMPAVSVCSLRAGAGGGGGGVAQKGSPPILHPPHPHPPPRNKQNRPLILSHPPTCAAARRAGSRGRRCAPARTRTRPRGGSGAPPSWRPRPLGGALCVVCCVSCVVCCVCDALQLGLAHALAVDLVRHPVGGHDLWGGRCVVCVVCRVWCVVCVMRSSSDSHTPSRWIWCATQLAATTFGGGGGGEGGRAHGVTRICAALDMHPPTNTRTHTRRVGRMMPPMHRPPNNDDKTGDKRPPHRQDDAAHGTRWSAWPPHTYPPPPPHTHTRTQAQRDTRGQPTDRMMPPMYSMERVPSITSTTSDMEFLR